MPEFRKFRPFLPTQEALPALYRTRGNQKNDTGQPENGINGLLQALMPGLTTTDQKAASVDALHLWESWEECGLYTRHPQPAFVLYKVRYRARWQHGWIGLSDARDLLRNQIRKHEHVRADRISQLMEFTTATGLHTTPVFLSHPQHPGLSRLMFEVQSGAPQRSGKLPDGREFHLWIVDDLQKTDQIRRGIEELSCLYIADGHHRAAVAETQAVDNRERDFIPMLSVLVPANELHVYPFYRRILNDEGPHSLWELIDKLRVHYHLRPCLIEQMYYQFLPNGQYLLCTHDACWQLIKKEQKTKSPNHALVRPEDLLDVGLLHSEIIGPFLGITDPGSDPRIDYGPLSMHFSDFRNILHDSRTAFVLIARAPTADDIFRVADSGGVMPPKSTSVEPKIIDGLVVWRNED